MNIIFSFLLYGLVVVIAISMLALTPIIILIGASAWRELRKELSAKKPVDKP